MLSATVDGLEAVQARLDAYPAALASGLTQKASALASALADKVKFEKLAGEVLNPRSGALSASIAAEISSDAEDVSASVGSFGDVKYAAIQEYGGRTRRPGGREREAGCALRRSQVLTPLLLRFVTDIPECLRTEFKRPYHRVCSRG